MENLFLKISVAFFPIVSCQYALSSEQKPNIIYILADDLGYSEIGSFGQEKIETPNIDALAEKGMRFTQHYSGSAVSAPSRCALMTGRHSGKSQIRGNSAWAERGDVRNYEAVAKNPYLEGQLPLKPGTQTIGRLLQSAGYKTGIAGKWGLGGPLTDGIPNKQGFDFFYGYNCQWQAHTYFPLHLWKNTEKVLLNNRMVPSHTLLSEGADPYNLESYSDYWLTDFSAELIHKEVIQFIKDNKEQPFFMYYASTIPHNPLQAPKRWVDYYVEKFGDEEPYLGENGYFPHRYPHACYAAMISYLDEQVGEIISTLKELGLYENTLIIFSSDNGPTTNSGGADSPWFDSAKPFKSENGWAKGNLTEGGIRVPMIAHWPNKVKPGTESDHISAFYDVLPTICDIVDIEPIDKTDGISFLPTLLGDKEQPKHEFLYWEFHASGGQQALRYGKWKALRKNISKGILKTELYNLEEDIQELNDVSSQYPEIVKKIEAIFKREHTTPELDAFRIEALEI